jgi:DNA modification methylase
MATLHHGDCLEVLRGMANDSVDSVVTDPPYGLSFMGKKWDYDVPSEDIWRECSAGVEAWRTFVGVCRD